MEKKKDLNTYVDYNCLENTLSEKYQGLRIEITDSAMRELMKEGKTIFHVLKILEEGYDAPRKRREEIIEKWLDRGNKTFNVVVTKSYHEILNEERWILIHFGKFTRRRK